MPEKLWSQKNIIDQKKINARKAALQDNTQQ